MLRSIQDFADLTFITSPSDCEQVSSLSSHHNYLHFTPNNHGQWTGSISVIVILLTFRDSLIKSSAPLPPGDATTQIVPAASHPRTRPAAGLPPADAALGMSNDVEYVCYRAIADAPVVAANATLESASESGVLTAMSSNYSLSPC